MKFSTERALYPLLKWTRRMKDRESYTLVGMGVHFKHLEPQYLQDFDQAIGGGRVILAAQFKQADGNQLVYFLSVAKSAHKCWIEYCAATNLMLPMLARQAANPILVLQNASVYMQAQREEIQTYHEVDLPAFVWKPKDEVRDADEYNHLFNGAVTLKDGKIIKKRTGRGFSRFGRR